MQQLTPAGKRRLISESRQLPADLRHQPGPSAPGRGLLGAALEELSSTKTLVHLHG